MTIDDTAYEYDDDDDDDDPEDSTAYYQDYFRLTTTYHEAMQLLDDNMRVGDDWSAHRMKLDIDEAVFIRKPFVLWVARVGWDSPDKPFAYFFPFRYWKKSPTPEMIDRAKQAAFHDRRFFMTCSYCNQIKNIGHMFRATRNQEMCQGCATRYLGVVY